MARISLISLSTYVLVALTVGCDQPATQPAIDWGIDLRPVPAVTRTIGETYLVFADSAPICADASTLGYLPRGSVFEALDYLPGHERVYAKVQQLTADGALLEGWVDLSLATPSKPLATQGMHILPLTDGSGFEVRLGQTFALQLSASLQTWDEESIAAGVEAVAGPLAEVAGAAATGAITSNPTAAEAGGKFAEFACQVVIYAAKSNVAKFKADLAGASAYGDIVITLKPWQTGTSAMGALSTLAAKSLSRQMLCPEFYGDVEYMNRMYYQLSTISPITFLDSRCWSITPLPQ